MRWTDERTVARTNYCFFFSFFLFDSFVIHQFAIRCRKKVDYKYFFRCFCSWIIWKLLSQRQQLLMYTEKVFFFSQFGWVYDWFSDCDWPLEVFNENWIWKLTFSLSGRARASDIALRQRTLGGARLNLHRRLRPSFTLIHLKVAF